MRSFEKLLSENKAWSKNRQSNDPEFFKRLAQLQTPEFLWIGCSDSRVPTNEITGTQPGEIFVHRNIANLVIDTDVNLLSVLYFAVNHLKVKHVIVCGHYGCGGIKAAMSNSDFKQILNMWLRKIKDVYKENREELDAIADMEKRENRLTELNVVEQVRRLMKTSIIQKAWKDRQAPDLHGWVYSLNDGVINPIYHLKANTAIDPLYRYDDL
ncbi:MAG: carbonic anhydrase [Chitinophagaceae bacterium]|mgnify:FL=1|nr:carbonic anhydrase [Chitinophagaceae bacterium]MBP6046951.1 carbonic anhydrase [Ferruginibacter sp.]MBK7347059.1 carbonic anhydrase [Chitinophagaceae bacterium]MBK7735038.1 carbonic anhydrase [Chitinophagaceae bacterium]MBL0253746.1 carbonic anhydrase [Chitinophagaceae bacterium]